MTNERYKALMADDGAELTPEEILQGWHFCWDWDGLLVSPEMFEARTCQCCETKAEHDVSPETILVEPLE